MILTMERLRILQVIHDLTKQSEFNVAQIQKLIDELGKSRGAVAKLMTKLRREGYVENPLRGGWRLTTKGREELLSFTQGDRNI